MNRIPALRSYTVDMKELDDGVDNVIDFKFLHGYNEPTIVFIYEPIKTYVGYGSLCLLSILDLK